MDIPEEAKSQIVSVAQESLSTFDSIARAAQKALDSPPGSGPDALAAINTLTNLAAVQLLAAISRETRAGYQALTYEPAIARLVAVTPDRKQRVYYICRATPIGGVANLASYRAPIGRLASLPIGSELTLPDGTQLELLEKVELHPIPEAPPEWDSRDTTFEAEAYGPITFASLRAAISFLAQPAEDLLSQILSCEEQRANIIQGRRRGIITKMELRDQPVLDAFQDEIFRLPLDSRLLLLGPPGTGKTTTLIRRLGQKLDLHSLSDREQLLVTAAAPQARSDHSASWLMFTPTDLLRQYLKEAFAREGVAASDLHIRTWEDYRRDLARNTFGILRSGSGRGTFILKENAGTLAPKALEAPIAWASEFDAWQRTAFLGDLRNSVDYLAGNVDISFRPMAERLARVFAGIDGSGLESLFLAIKDEDKALTDLTGRLKDTTEQRIQSTLNLLLNRNRNFIDALAEFLGTLGAGVDADVDAEEGDEAEGEDEPPLADPTPRLSAVSAYMRALRAYARFCAGGRPVRRDSRSGRVIEWLSERLIERSKAAEIGTRLRLLSNARRLARPVTRYINGMTRRYRAFRRINANGWYRNDIASTSDLDPLEADVLLLSILRGARSFTRGVIATAVQSEPFWSALLPALSLYKNQICIDEVTDFSAIQIACMYFLSNPRTNSMFACGDLNQRLTTWGARSVADLRWSVPGVELREVSTCYRQSRQLYEFSRSLIEVTGGSIAAAELPVRANSEGVPPALLERAEGRQLTAEWLAARTREIEASLGKLPSIAVFVDGESQVQPIAECLGAALAADNVRVMACPNGRVIGHDADVRVFDVHHVKGLEFEAVFFVGIDRFAASHADLLDKYLYVGATRAATYLGVTCDAELPKIISALRGKFVRSWKDA